MDEKKKKKKKKPAVYMSLGMYGVSTAIVIA